MNKKITSVLCLVMVMLTIALSIPSAAAQALTSRLMAPTELKSESTSSSITLSWKAAESATGYRIYYLTRCGWQRYTEAKGTSITFKNLPAGTRYTIAVRSYYTCDCHSGRVTWSKDYAKIETATAPNVPAKVKVEGNGSGLKISWSASKGASGYALYYNHPPFGWKEIGKTTGTSMNIKKVAPCVVYTFAVRPYIQTANTTVWGDYKQFTGAAAPKATTLEVKSPSKGTVNIKWSRVLGADGYALYYKYNNGSYKLYKTYEKPQELTFTGLKAGKYTFVVRPYVKTSLGTVCAPYTPVSVQVSGLLPCGCEPVCAYCGPNTKHCDCHRGHRH